MGSYLKSQPPPGRGAANAVKPRGDEADYSGKSIRNRPRVSFALNQSQLTQLSYCNVFLANALEAGRGLDRRVAPVLCGYKHRWYLVGMSIPQRHMRKHPRLAINPESYGRPVYRARARPGGARVGRSLLHVGSRYQDERLTQTGCWDGQWGAPRTRLSTTMSWGWQQGI